MPQRDLELGTWKSDPARLTDASKVREVQLEPGIKVHNKGRRQHSEKVKFIHSYPPIAIRKKVGYLTGKGLSLWSCAGMSDFGAELEAGVGSILLRETEDLAVLFLI